MPSNVNSLITREKADALIVEQTISNQIIQGAIKNSKALQLLTRLANMTSKQARMPVLASLPEAYWVSGDTGLKQTTEMMWKNKFITAEELAVYIPIPEAVLDDAEYDIWGEVRPRIEEAMGKKIDQAIFFGKNKPASFREGLIPTAINAGAIVTPSSSETLYQQISNAMGYVEDSGYDATGIVGGVALRKSFRDGLLDTTGQPLANSEVTELNRQFIDNGTWDNTVAKFLVGDFRQAVYSIRQDITYKIITEGVISDDDGKVILNLAQQDCVALRVVMRMGWEVPNPINATNPDESVRFPFAVVTPTTAPTTYTVTFTVKDNQGTPVAISGAEVTYDGQTKKTNASGVATFKSLGNSNGLYKASKSGYKPDYGEVTVATSAVSKNVTLIAKS